MGLHLRGGNMNSKKIEMGAILVLKQVIFKSKWMVDYINDNDKEPSWDGLIYLYRTEDLKVEDIEYKIPIQVKGKNDQSVLKKQYISYQVEYKHLRNYYHDGGVFFVVVVMSDDGEQSAIFYNLLTTIKLDDLLKGTDSKKPDDKKSIHLLRLEKEYSVSLLKLLKQFGKDRESQGSGNSEIIKKSINIGDMDKVDYIKAISYLASNETDLLKEISTGEISLYGHRADLDMWLPFNYSHQREIVFKRFVQMNKPVGIDGVNYYDFYLVEGLVAKDDKPIIRLSENLTLDFMGGKINFDTRGNLTTLLRDVQFINKLKVGSQIFVDNQKMTDITDINIPKAMRDKIQLVLDLENAFKEIGIRCDKRFDAFTEENWKHINELLNLYHRRLKPKEGKDSAWYIWNWDDVVVPLMLNVNENKEIDIINWFTTKKYALFVNNEMQCALPNFILFKRDILEKLYNVPKQIWVDEIERIKYSEENIPEILLFFVEILSSYDRTRNEIYFEVAELLVDKVLEVRPDDEYAIINKLQLQKRKSVLTEAQINVLETLEEKTTESLAKCAINILLDNKRIANKLISELPEEKQVEMMNYPIYNLL